MTGTITPRESHALVDLVEVFQPRKILEFGSWQGRSALRFLAEMKRLELDGEITCVDTWLGSPEHWDPLNDHPEWGHQNLLIKNGEPGFIEVFKSAIAEYGFTDRLKILRCSSVSSERYLAAKKWRADLTYVDADHSANSVASDVLIASRISPSGNIAGDDWCWPSVQRGILKANRKLRRKILVAEDQFAWILIPRGKHDFAEQLVSRGWKIRSTAGVRLFLVAHKVLRAFRQK